MPITGSSLESFEKAAEEALMQLPADPESLQGLRSARIDELRIEHDGFVGQTQYIVTISPSPAYYASGSDKDGKLGVD